MIEYYPNIYSDVTLVAGYSPPTDGMVNMVLDNYIIDVSGDGSLSGSYPDGIVTDKNVPTESDITITLRQLSNKTLDRLVVARTKSAQDGTWVVNNLNKSLRFNVISTKVGRNDIIASDVTPV